MYINDSEVPHGCHFLPWRPKRTVTALSSHAVLPLLRSTRKHSTLNTGSNLANTRQSKLRICTGEHCIRRECLAAKSHPQSHIWLKNYISSGGDTVGGPELDPMTKRQYRHCLHMFCSVLPTILMKIRQSILYLFTGHTKLTSQGQSLGYVHCTTSYTLPVALHRPSLSGGSSTGKIAIDILYYVLLPVSLPPCSFNVLLSESSIIYQSYLSPAVGRGLVGFFELHSLCEDARNRLFESLMLYRPLDYSHASRLNTLSAVYIFGILCSMLCSRGLFLTLDTPQTHFRQKLNEYPDPEKSTSSVLSV